jgi:hypothetical protein
MHRKEEEEEEEAANGANGDDDNAVRRRLGLSGAAQHFTYGRDHQPQRCLEPGRRGRRSLPLAAAAPLGLGTCRGARGAQPYRPAAI